VEAPEADHAEAVDIVGDREAEPRGAHPAAVAGEAADRTDEVDQGAVAVPGGAVATPASEASTTPSGVYKRLQGPHTSCLH